MSRHHITRLFHKAEQGGYALGAFNFSTAEILRGITQAALKLKSPVIISNSEGERNFFGVEESVAMYRYLRTRQPIVLHADHTKTFAEIKRAVDAGYPSVHFDGSELPYEENVKQTRMAADYAHMHDVFIEGELGSIRGGSTSHKENLSEVVKEEFLTKPEQAKDFVERTGVDSLAISVGNAHGMWAEQKKLDFERIKAIKRATRTFLVLHGGSGTNGADFRKAIECGINKINVNTETRLAFEKALIKGLETRTDDVPYRYLGKVSEAVSKVIEEKIITFRSDGKA